MIHHSTPSRPPPAGRGIPRVRQWAAGLAVATASLAGAPAALAVPLSLPGGATGTPVTPPPATAAAHLTVWTVVTILAATVVLSVATTLITLSLEHRHRTRRTPPVPVPPADAQPVSIAAEPPAGQDDIISSHQHLASYDIHQASSQ